jgi:mRNA-degrading endonuclease toxin of MazEF toxin-antitoxin module
MSSLALGSHSLTAVYPDDGNFLTSTSSAVVVTVGQATTATTLTVSATEQAQGRTVIFTANVSANSPRAHGLGIGRE